MNPREKTISWSASGEAIHPYETYVDGKRWQIRIGDFPAEAMYTLLIDGHEQATFEDWPATWNKPSSPPTARYYLVNDRPVRFIPTADGGMDIQALNMRTGEFERALEYLTKVIDPFADVDSVPETDFNIRVNEVRENL